MNKKKNLLLVFNIFLIIVLTVFDQFTKYLAIIKLQGKPDYIIFHNIFQLHYLENRGAAFGMLKNQKIFFIFIAVVIVTLIIYTLVKLPATKHFYIAEFLLVMIASGAIGNMIDRMRFNYVVDFFYFSLINFPVFNVADIYVTVGTIILIILILFYYKEEDFKYLKLQVSKNDEIN